MAHQPECLNDVHENDVEMGNDDLDDSQNDVGSHALEQLGFASLKRSLELKSGQPSSQRKRTTREDHVQVSRTIWREHKSDWIQTTTKDTEEGRKPCYADRGERQR